MKLLNALMMLFCVLVLVVGLGTTSSFGIETENLSKSEADKTNLKLPFTVNTTCDISVLISPNNRYRAIISIGEAGVYYFILQDTNNDPTAPITLINNDKPNYLLWDITSAMWVDDSTLLISTQDVYGTAGIYRWDAKDGIKRVLYAPNNKKHDYKFMLISFNKETKLLTYSVDKNISDDDDTMVEKTIILKDKR